MQAEQWIREANIHVSTNNAKYGDHANQDHTVTTNDTISFQDFNLADLYFKNATAGSNTEITAVCILMTEKRKQELGVYGL